MNSKKMTYGARRLVLATAIASLLGSVGLSPASAAQSTNNAVAVQAKQAALAAWHQSIRHMAPPTEGCFHVAYPSVIWEKVACGKARVAHPVPPQKAMHNLLARASPLPVSISGLQMVGGGNDYLAQTQYLTQSVTGSFPSVTNVTSINSSGAMAGTGATGLNQYAVQLNTNSGESAICDAAPPGSLPCQVTVQFLYQSDGTSGVVYMQNWLTGWGVSQENMDLAKTEQSLLGIPIVSNQLIYGTSCPVGWTSEAGGCMRNSAAATTPAIPISSLANMSLEGSANANGDDEVLFTDGQDSYSEVQPDSTVDIASVWDQSEFNVFANGGGGTGNFNPGASITVKLQVDDGSWLTPACVGPQGTGITGETNNLTLGLCTATGETIVPTTTGFSLASPYIQFTESD